MIKMFASVETESMEFGPERLCNFVGDGVHKREPPNHGSRDVSNMVDELGDAVIHKEGPEARGNFVGNGIHKREPKIHGSRDVNNIAHEIGDVVIHEVDQVAARMTGWTNQW